MKRLFAAMLAVSLVFCANPVYSYDTEYEEIRLCNMQTFISFDSAETTALVVEGRAVGSEEWETIPLQTEGVKNDALSFFSATNALCISDTGIVSAVSVGGGVVTAEYTNSNGLKLSHSLFISAYTGNIAVSAIGETEISSAELAANLSTYPSYPNVNEKFTQASISEMWFYDNMTKEGGGIASANDAQGGNQWYVYIGANNLISETNYYIQDNVLPIHERYKNGMPTAVKRSKAWHQVIVDATRLGHVYVYLDGIMIYSKQSAHTAGTRFIIERGLKGGDMLYKNFRAVKISGNKSARPVVDGLHIVQREAVLSAQYDSVLYAPDQSNLKTEVIWQRAPVDGDYTDIAHGKSIRPAAASSDYLYRFRITARTDNGFGKPYFSAPFRVQGCNITELLCGKKQYEKIRINGTPSILQNGESTAIIAEGKINDDWQPLADNEGMSFSSSSNAIEVSGSGFITPLTYGSSVIYATYLNPDGTLISASACVSYPSDTCDTLQDGELTFCESGLFEFEFYDSLSQDCGKIDFQNGEAYQFALTPANDVYMLNNNSVGMRSFGWHRITVDSLQKGLLFIYIDGARVYEGMAAHTAYEGRITISTVGEMMYRSFHAAKTVSAAYRPIVEEAEIFGIIHPLLGGTLCASYGDIRCSADGTVPGVGFNWQRSSDGENYSTLAGQTSISCEVVPEQTGAFYRAQITAVGGIPVYSEPVFVPPISDYQPQPDNHVYYYNDFENSGSDGITTAITGNAAVKVEDDGTGNHALKFIVPKVKGARADVTIPFAEQPVSAGKLKITFDYKIENHASQLLNWPSVRNNTDNNLSPSDSVFSMLSNTNNICLKSTSYATQKIADYKNSYVNTQIIIDFDNQVYEIYYNGVKNSPTTLGLLQFNNETVARLLAFTVCYGINGADAGNGVYYLDNIKVESGSSLNVLKALPREKLSEISVDRGASFQFDGCVSEAYVNKEYFTVLKNGQPTQEYELILTDDKKTVVIRFPDKMDYNCRYTASALAGIKDDRLNGVLANDVSVSYKTASRYKLGDVSLSGDGPARTATVYARLSDCEQSGETASIIACMYDKDGRLISTNVSETAPKESSGFCAGFRVPEEESESYSFKVFAVGGNGITPLCENVTVAYSAESTEPLKLYVAADGNDSNEGTFASPLATFTGAQNKIKKIKASAGLPKGGVVVCFRGGIYKITSPIKLAAADSGSLLSPVVYRSYPGETAVMSGSVRLDASKATAVTDDDALRKIPSDAIDKIIQLDISKDASGNDIMLGQPNSSNWTQLVFNAATMDAARYPNQGDGYLKIGKVSSTATNTVFACDDSMISEVAGDADLMSVGWWTNDYEATRQNVSSVDGSAKTVTFSSKFTANSGKRFVLYNSLSFLDSPGEYVIDRNKKLLFFYPADDFKAGTAELTDYSGTMLSASGVSNVTLRNITFDGGKGTCIDTSACNNFIVDGCTVRNFNGGAVNFWNTQDCALINSKISYISERAVNAEGGAGKAPGIVSCGLRIVNNEFHDFGRKAPGYLPVYWAHGYNGGTIGTYLAYNKIYNSPGQALSCSLENIIEYNDIHNVCSEVGDMGAIYMGMTHTKTRGAQIRYNYIHDMPMYFTSDGGWGTNGIYLDENAGVTIFGNVIANIERNMILLALSSKNVVKNNVLIGDPNALGLLYYDNAQTIRSNGSSGYNASNKTKWYDSWTYSAPDWLQKYPEIKRELDEKTWDDASAVIEDNLLYRCSPMVLADATLNAAATSVKNNYQTATDPGFVDAANKNYQLTDDSEVFSQIPGFEMINMSKIGLITDRIYRSVGDGMIFKAGSPLSMCSDGVSLISSDLKLTPYLQEGKFFVPVCVANELIGGTINGENSYVDAATLLRENDIPFVLKNGVLVVNPETFDAFSDDCVLDTINSLLNQN